MKKCPKCRETDLTKFGKHRSKKDGLRTLCKKCDYSLNKEYKLKNKEKVKEINTTWIKSNKQHKNSYSKVWCKQNQSKLKVNNLKKYWPNLSPEQILNSYQELLSSQNYRCAICNRHQNEFKKALAVDHCHKTGKVRGLLCIKCNPGIGYLCNSSTICLSAAKYLAESM